MDNYEINILRRGGNWKKVRPDDLINDEINNVPKENKKLNQKSQNDFLFNVTKIDSIISKLETLETEKNKLKEELKKFEDAFLKKKKIAEVEINIISKEKEMIEKTISIIKSLKSF